MYYRNAVYVERYAQALPWALCPSTPTQHEASSQLSPKTTTIPEQPTTVHLFINEPGFLNKGVNRHHRLRLTYRHCWFAKVAVKHALPVIWRLLRIDSNHTRHQARGVTASLETAIFSRCVLFRQLLWFFWGLLRSRYSAVVHYWLTICVPKRQAKITALSRCVGAPTKL